MEEKDIEMKLAKKRTELSILRTLMSYIRTSIVFITLALALWETNKNLSPICIALFTLSAVFILFGIVDYFLAKSYIKHIDNK